MKLHHFLFMSAALLCIVGASSSESHAAKEKFVRTKPHVNVSGPYNLDNDTIRIDIGLIDPVVQGGLAGPLSDGSCTGTLTLRVMDASNPEGNALAESVDLALDTRSAQSLEYVSGSGGSESVYAVVAAEDMDVDGKSCVLRGRIQVRDNVTANVEVDTQVFRQEFGQVKAKSRL